MPAMVMKHEIDPKDAVLDALGDIDSFEVFNTQVLCAVYERPKVTAGGIHLADVTREEDKSQGKVALIVKAGPDAFQDKTGKWHWPENIGVGDWVYFRASDGWAVTVNRKLCRIVDDVDIRGRIQQPDQVW